MLHPRQSFLTHKPLFAKEEYRSKQRYMEPQQDVPLNLSCRKIRDISTANAKVKDSENILEWSGVHAIPYVSKISPWCFPWVSYPLLPISEHGMRHNQVCWSLLQADIPEKLHVPESQAPPTCSKYQFEHPSEETPCSLTPKVDDQDAKDNESSRADEDKDKDKNRNPLQKQRKIPSAGKPSFMCVQCGVSYPHRFELNRHVKVSHVRPHRCDHCGKRFGHKNYLQVHIETVHLGRKSHKCEMCGKYLSTGGNLSVHVRTIHMGEKKYKCWICSRSFGQQCNMKTHMKRHFCKNE